MTVSSAVAGEVFYFDDLTVMGTQFNASLDEAVYGTDIDIDYVYERPRAVPEGMTPGEWGSLLGRVIRRVEIDKRRITIHPVVGDPTVWTY